MFLWLALAGVVSTSVQAQGVLPDGAYYTFTLNGTLQNTGSGAAKWQSGTVTFAYTQTWLADITDPENVTVTPYAPGSLTITGVTGSAGWITNLNTATSIPVASYARSYYSSTGPAPFSLTKASPITTWIKINPQDPSFALDPNYVGIFSNFSFMTPGINKASSPGDPNGVYWQADNTSLNAYNFTLYTMGCSGSATTADWSACGSGPNISSVVYTGSLVGAVSANIVVPEMNASLWPKICLLIICLYMLFRNKLPMVKDLTLI